MKRRLPLPWYLEYERWRRERFDSGFHRREWRTRQAAFDDMARRQEGGLDSALATRKRKHRTAAEKAEMRATATLWLLDEHPDLGGSDENDP